MTGARTAARPPLRVARAVVLACLAAAVGAGSHLLTSLFMFLAGDAVAGLLTRRRAARAV